MTRVRALAVGIALVLGTALVGLASLPTGASAVAGVVPDTARVAVRQSLGGARVLLLSDLGRLRLMVAYRQEKGWFAARVAPVPRDTVAAWAATSGKGDVPAFSAVYGRSAATTITIRWLDGRSTIVKAAGDGFYLAVREGRHRAGPVLLMEANGATREVLGL